MRVASRRGTIFAPPQAGPLSDPAKTDHRSEGVDAAAWRHVVLLLLLLLLLLPSGLLIQDAWASGEGSLVLLLLLLLFLLLLLNTISERCGCGGGVVAMGSSADAFM